MLPRLYTLRYGGSDRKQPLSIGRVQTPTLALIVERQEAIENFKSETYWELKTRYREVIFSADKGKYSDKAKADAALQSITGEPFTITSVKKKDGKESAPKLFDLTSLQVACNRKFGMSAEETLATVQSLYEKKVTTYLVSIPLTSAKTYILRSQVSCEASSSHPISIW